MANNTQEPRGDTPGPAGSLRDQLRERAAAAAADTFDRNNPAAAEQQPLSAIKRTPTQYGAREDKNRPAAPVKPMKIESMAAPGQWKGGAGDLPGLRKFTPEELAAPPPARGERAAAPEAPPTAPRSSPRAAPPRAPAVQPVFRQHIRPIFGEVPQGWMRVDLPSRCTFYDFEDVAVRPFDTPDLAALFEAQAQGDSTLFYDAMQACLNQDIRDLTGPDLRGLMVWWKLHSYGKAPWRLHWTSRYGNRNETQFFSGQQFEEVVLQMSREEFRAYQAEGFCVPTVRDSEYLERLKPKNSEAWLLDRAQYLASDDRTAEGWYPSRLARLKEGGPELLVRLKEFRNKIEHGVKSTVEVVDKHFDPVAASAYLHAQAQRLSALVDARGDQLPPAEYVAASEQIADLLEEALELDETLAELARAHEEQLTVAASGEPPVDPAVAAELISGLQDSLKPRKEVIPLRIQLMDFFSEI